MSAPYWICEKDGTTKGYSEGRYDRGCPECGETMVLDADMQELRGMQNEDDRPARGRRQDDED